MGLAGDFAIILIFAGVTVGGITAAGMAGPLAAEPATTATSTPTGDSLQADGGLTVESGTATETPDSQLGDEFEKTVAKAVHERVNTVRESQNRDPLHWKAPLAQAANYHSENMVAEGFYAHQRPESGERFPTRYRLFNYECEVPTGEGKTLNGAENILKTYYQTDITGPDGDTVRYDTPEELATGVVSEWLASDRHAAILLQHEWRQEGIGVEVTDEDGLTAVYVTQNFC